MSGQIAREPARKLALGALCLAALALTGCMPAHRAPPALAGLDIPQGWTAPQHPTLSADTRIGAQWWRSFGDAALDRHVEAALARNTDLLLAGTRLDAALAQLRLAQSALGPTLRASAKSVNGACAGKPCAWHSAARAKSMFGFSPCSSITYSNSLNLILLN